MIMHCKQGYVQVKLLDVAYAPGVQFNLFSLHTVMPKFSVSIDTEGVYVLDGGLSFLRRDAGSCVEATRVVETPISAAVLAPGKMRRIGTNDLHVFLANSHADTLRETARQMGIKVFGELVPCAECSEAKGRRMAVPSTTECRSTRPLDRLFVDLTGQQPRSAGGAQLLITDMGAGLLFVVWAHVVEHGFSTHLIIGHLRLFVVYMGTCRRTLT